MGVALSVLGLLESADLCAVERTCSYLRALCVRSSDVLWAPLFHRRFAHHSHGPSLTHGFKHAFAECLRRERVLADVNGPRTPTRPRNSRLARLFSPGAAPNVVSSSRSFVCTFGSVLAASAPHATISVCLLGPLGVGKSSIFARFNGAPFEPLHQTTFGSRFAAPRPLASGVSVSVWDTSGHHRYRPLVTNVIKSCDVLACCFAVDDVESFDGVCEIAKEMCRSSESHALVALVGCKADLPAAVSATQTMQFIESLVGAFPELRVVSTSCSALDNDVEELFNTLARAHTANRERRELISATATAPGAF